MGRGGRNPFRAMKYLGADCPAGKFLTDPAAQVVCTVPVKVLSRGLCLPVRQPEIMR